MMAFWVTDLAWPQMTLAPIGAGGGPHPSGGALGASLALALADATIGSRELEAPLPRPRGTILAEQWSAWAWQGIAAGRFAGVPWRRLGCCRQGPILHSEWNAGELLVVGRTWMVTRPAPDDGPFTLSRARGLSSASWSAPEQGLASGVARDEDAAMLQAVQVARRLGLVDPWHALDLRLREAA